MTRPLVIFFLSAILCFFTVIPTSPALSAETSLVAAGSFTWYPYLRMDKKTGEAKGVLCEVLTEVGRRADIDISFTYFPWKRVLDNARHGDIDIICGLYWTKERAEYIDYTIPLYQDVVRLFATRDLHINSLEDLKGLRGTAILGSSYGTQFDAFAKAHLNLTRVPDKAPFITRLLHGDTDYVVCGENDCLSYFKENGGSETIFPLPFVVSSSDVHLGFSKRSPKSHLFPRIHDELGKMRDDGTLKKIINDYMNK